MDEVNEITVSQQEFPVGQPSPWSAPPQRSIFALIIERWRITLLVTALTAGASLGAVWLLVKPEYEVSTSIHVAPVVRPILVADPDTDLRGNYFRYVGTVAADVVSTAVVGAAVNRPEVRSLDLIAASEDPVALIKSLIDVKPVSGTEHLRVTMCGEDPNALATIVNTVLEAFMARRETRQRERDDRILSSLKGEQIELEAKLKVKARQLRESAIDQGLGRAEDSSSLVELWMTEIQQLLTQANKERAMAAARLALLNGDENNAGVQDPDPAGFEEYSASDPELRALREQLRSVELSALSDAGMGRGPSHPDVQGRPALIDALGERITRRETKLADAFATTQRRMLEGELRNAEVAIRVYEAELGKLNEKRAEFAGKQFVLEDLRHERAQYEKSLAKVREKIWNVEVEQNRTARVTLTAAAQPPATPNVDKRLKYGVIAALMSLCLGAGAAIIRSRSDTSFRDPLEVTQRLGVRVLGSIQNITDGELVSHEIDPRLSEPIRSISTALLAGAQTDATHSRLITSPTAASGKSSLALNLARSLAATGRRVLLVDADNHGQGLSRRLGMRDQPGLAELLDGRTTIEEALQGRDLPNLKILPAGKRCEQFGDIVCERRAQVRLRSLFEGYDEVIVDSPPVLAKSDAVVLATLVDEVILVLRAGSSTTEEGFAAQRFLGGVGANIVGVILNAVDPKNMRYGYNYTYSGAYSEGLE